MIGLPPHTGLASSHWSHLLTLVHAYLLGLIVEGQDWQSSLAPELGTADNRRLVSPSWDIEVAAVGVTQLERDGEEGEEEGEEGEEEGREGGRGGKRDGKRMGRRDGKRMGSRDAKRMGRRDGKRMGRRVQREREAWKRGGEGRRR